MWTSCRSWAAAVIDARAKKSAISCRRVADKPRTRAAVFPRQPVAGFSATAKGCSYLPFSGSVLSSLAGDLEGYGQTKGSLHFDPADPLTTTLVRKLIRSRIAER